MSKDKQLFHRVKLLGLKPITANLKDGTKIEGIELNLHFYNRNKDADGFTLTRTVTHWTGNKPDADKVERLQWISMQKGLFVKKHLYPNSKHANRILDFTHETIKKICKEIDFDYDELYPKYLAKLDADYEVIKAKREALKQEQEQELATAE